MKIAILTPFLHREGGHGGITTWLLNVAPELNRRGHEVEVLISAPAHRALEHARLDKTIKIRNLGNKKYSLYRNLFSYFRQQRPDIVLSAGYRYNTAIAYALPLSRAKTKWVMTIRENLSLAVGNMRWQERWQRTATIRLCLSVADKVIGVSSDLTRDMVENWGLKSDKAGAIHNAVVDDRVVEKGGENVDHPFFTSGEKVLVAIGRLENQKDYPTLFNAFADLVKTDPARLIILGEGSLRDALQKLIDQMGISDRIALAGFTKNPFSYMRQADGVVMSSIWEGFGNVLAEALAQGTPIVSTDCPSGPAEILDGGKFGPLVPVGDVPALTEGMRKVLNDPLPESTLKSRAQAFSVSARVSDYITLFEQLLERR